jgi:putative oxygen-independent coproporphyrinogen III oxidase
MRPLDHLYVHVPFCPSICPFCSFHVLTRRPGAVDAYLDGLERELDEVAARYGRGPLRTVYLGGGTPSHLTAAELERLVGSIRARFDGWDAAEVTIEAHPGNVGPALAMAWRELGVTRASLGVQSTFDHVLRALGRPHDAATALAALDTLLGVDGWTVSVDVITAVDGQDVEADLRRLASTGVDHLSAYTLTIEPGTPFARRRVTVDPDAELRALRLAGEVLPTYGLHRYEVSNHARPGAVCAHNQAYWAGRFWVGVGPSAASHEPGPDDAHPAQRRSNPPFAQWLEGDRGTPEVLAAADVLREATFTGLRTTAGIDLAALRARFPTIDDEEFEAIVGAPARRAVEEGTLELAAGHLRATAAGLLVLDRVGADFL